MTCKQIALHFFALLHRFMTPHSPLFPLAPFSNPTVTPFFYVAHFCISCYILIRLPLGEREVEKLINCARYLAPFFLFSSLLFFFFLPVSLTICSHFDPPPARFSHSHSLFSLCFLCSLSFAFAPFLACPLLWAKVDNLSASQFGLRLCVHLLCVSVCGSE